MERPWKFSMTPQHGPMWDLYDEDGDLVAYARRAEDGGWAIRIKHLTPDTHFKKIYIGAEEPPIGFMNLMLELHKENKS